MRLAVALVLAACGTPHEPPAPPVPVANIAIVDAAPEPDAAIDAEPSAYQPTCDPRGPDGAACAEETLAHFADLMCACTDGRCALHVLDGVDAWIQILSTTDTSTAIEGEQSTRLAAQTKRMIDCQHELMHTP